MKNFLAVLAVLVLSSSLFAGEIIKMSEDPWPPFTFGKAGSITTKGIATDINQELFKRLGLKVETRLYPWKRCLMQMKRGKRDGLMLLSINEERKSFLKFSISIMSDKNLLWYKKNNKKVKEWKKFKDLKKYKIGITNGFNYGDKFNNANKKYNFKTDGVRTDKLNFKKLEANRIDIIICSNVTARTIFKKNPAYKKQFKSMKKPINESFLYIALSKKSKHVKLMKKINKELRKMKRDGTIRRILRKY